MGKGEIKLLDKVNNNGDIIAVNLDSQNSRGDHSVRKAMKKMKGKDSITLSGTITDYLQQRANKVDDSVKQGKAQRVNHDFSSFGFEKKVGGEDGLLF